MARAFDGFAAHRLWLDVYCDNARARRAYQALGFVEEGMQENASRKAASSDVRC
jgi:RimJ/RimL family protein N-acetyltransferase